MIILLRHKGFALGETQGNPEVKGVVPFNNFVIFV